MGESQLTTLMPLSWAALRAGTISSPELFEIMMALAPSLVAFVTMSICPGTLCPGAGPSNCSGTGFCSSLAASSAPSRTWSNNLLIRSLPSHFGTSTIFSALPGVAVACAAAPVGSARIASAAIITRNLFMALPLRLFRPAGGSAGAPRGLARDAELIVSDVQRRMPHHLAEPAGGLGHGIKPSLMSEKPEHNTPGAIDA